MFFVLAAACAAFAYTRFSTAIMLLQGMPVIMGIPVTSLVPGLLSALFIVLGIAFWTHRQKNATSAKQFEKVISDTLEQHVGSREITTANMDAFEHRMNTLADICGITAELKDAIASPLFHQLQEQGILSGEHVGGCVLYEKRDQVAAIASGSDG